MLVLVQVVANFNLKLSCKIEFKLLIVLDVNVCGNEKSVQIDYFCCRALKKIIPNHFHSMCNFGWRKIFVQFSNFLSSLFQPTFPKKYNEIFFYLSLWFGKYLPMQFQYRYPSPLILLLISSPQGLTLYRNLNKWFNFIFI